MVVVAGSDCGSGGGGRCISGCVGGCSSRCDSFSGGRCIGGERQWL